MNADQILDEDWRKPGPNWSLQVGDQLPNRDYWKLTADLGRGGCGVVFEAIQTDGSRSAIKCLAPRDPRLRGNDLNRLFFHRSSRALANLAGKPRLAAPLDVIDWRGSDPSAPPRGCAVAVIRRHCEGSLETWLRDRAKGGRVPNLKPEIAMTLAHAIAEALVDLHEQRLIHGDLTAANILIPRLERLDGSSSRIADDESDPIVILADLELVGSPRDLILLQTQAPTPPGWELGNELRYADDLHAMAGILNQLAQAVGDEAPQRLRETARWCGLHRRDADAPADDVLLSMLRLDTDPSLRIHFAPEGRESHAQELRSYIEKQDRKERGGIFVLEAQMGFGKSTLLAHWADGGLGDWEFWPLFRFSANDGVVKIDAMLHSLNQALAQRYPRLFAQADETQTRQAATLRERLERISQRRLSGTGRRLLLFIDGLDESESLERVVQALPKAPPRGVFLIASSNALGDAGVWLQGDASTHFFRPRENDEENLNAVAAYLDRRIAHLKKDDADALANLVGGIFQIAVLLCDSEPSEQEVRDLLLSENAPAASGLSHSRWSDYYLHWLHRIVVRILKQAADNEQRDHFLKLLGLAAVAHRPLDKASLCELLDLGPAQVQSILELSRWLVRNGDGHAGESVETIRTAHHGLRSCLARLTEKHHPLPLQESRRRLGLFILQRGRRNWFDMHPDDRMHVVRHLIAAAGDEKHGEQNDSNALRLAYECLINPLFIMARLGSKPREFHPTIARNMGRPR